MPCFSGSSVELNMDAVGNPVEGTSVLNAWAGAVAIARLAAMMLWKMFRMDHSLAKHSAKWHRNAHQVTRTTDSIRSARGTAVAVATGGAAPCPIMTACNNAPNRHPRRFDENDISLS